MHDVPALLGILVAISLGAMSPGPSFVMVARTAVSSSRRDGICAAIGMGTGGLVFAAAALFGLHGLLLAVPPIYAALKIAGGLYLMFVGLRILRCAKHEVLSSDGGSRDVSSATRAFMHGLMTQLSNPKTAIVYASVFAAFMPPLPTLAFDLAVGALVFGIESGWYVLVAIALSSKSPRRAYVSWKPWIDRAAGAVMVGLGFRLLASTQRV